MDTLSLSRLTALLVLAWAVLYLRRHTEAPDASRGRSRERLRRASVSRLAAPAPSPMYATRLALGEWGVIEGQAPVWPAPRPLQSDDSPKQAPEPESMPRLPGVLPEDDAPGRWN